VKYLACTLPVPGCSLKTEHTDKFHCFTMHFDSLILFTPTHALFHTTMYQSFKLY